MPPTTEHDCLAYINEQGYDFEFSESPFEGMPPTWGLTKTGTFRTHLGAYRYKDRIGAIRGAVRQVKKWKEDSP